ncbi:zinc metalloprotease HtpX [Bailinhaonella thermotolerans]|uniref:Protease HtpX homolog n=1 Tax=Bailinhaonella thermotolerans TaxID=1070861 RepID=A0A3A4B084_9ACTN|nr:zinc metalloprotease HtpX [Bailinhaonella thermotolerans]RJL31437.1 zinc metalloprotease HtpX [Bailinhaonella thermotolerans]
MTSGRFAPDKGLTRRMVTTMFLLGLLYVVFVAVLIALGVKAVTVLVIAVGFLLLQYFLSDKIALFAMNAKVVEPAQAPELHGLVDRLSAMADMPKPRVAIADSDVPNAFATGRNQKNSVVCVTTGLLRRLTPEELEGVLAHEMSHVAHRDVAVMTIASFLGLVAGLITRFGLQFGLVGGRDRRGNNAVPVFLVVVLVSAVVYAVSFLLTRALSRYRELSADRAGALLTGRPSALASALTKVSGDMAQIPTRDLRQAEPFNAFFLVPAFAQGFSLTSLFATHPPLERRLEQLGQISAQLSRGV